MPVRPSKSFRRKKRLSRLSRVKRVLYPDMRTGEGFQPTLRSQVGKRKKSVSFASKYADLQYPKFYIEQDSTTAVSTQALNPHNFGLATQVGTQQKAGYDGLQHIQTIHIKKREDVFKAFNKMRDVYQLGFLSDGPQEIPQSDPSTIYDYERAGVKMVNHGFTYNTTFVNGANVTEEFEVLICTPRMRIKKASSYQEYERDPYRGWIYAAARSGTEIDNQTINTYDLVADPLIDSNYKDQNGVSIAWPDYGVSPQQLGQRPYNKGVGRHFFKHWRIVDKKTFKLTPGVMQKYNFSYKKSALVDYEDLNNYHHIPFVDFYMMIISKGQVVNGTNVTTNVDVSTSDVCYYCSHKRYDCYQGRRFRRSVKFMEDAQVYFPDLTVAQQQFVNSDTNATTTYSSVTMG